MRFASPVVLWMLLAVPALAAWLVLILRGRRMAMARFTEARLLERLVDSVSAERLAVKAILLVLSSLFIVLAAARPQWGSTLEQVSHRGVDVLIGIDISESMLAEDLRPNRLQKSREEAGRFLERLDGDRVGLLAFAGSAGVLCPLTVDYNAVRIFLDTLRPDMISYPGTSLAVAIEAGAGAFSTEESKFKVMVLFTDGEDQVSAAEVEAAARAAAQQGIIIHTIGTGSPGGEPIPVRDENGEIIEYKKDTGGRVVTTRLDEAILAGVSEITGGQYFPATAAEAELDRIAEAIEAMDKKEMQGKLMTQYEERYQVPLAAGLAFLIADALIVARRSGRRRSGAVSASARRARAA